MSEQEIQQDPEIHEEEKQIEGSKSSSKSTEDNKTLEQKFDEMGGLIPPEEFEDQSDNDSSDFEYVDEATLREMDKNQESDEFSDVSSTSSFKTMKESEISQ